MKIFWRCVIIVLVVIGLSLPAAVVWVESASGIQFFCRLASQQVQKKFPETDILLEGLDLQFPLGLTLQKVQWRRKGTDPILILEAVSITGFSPWRAKADIPSINLAFLDSVVNQGKWGASGFMSGTVDASGNGSQVDALELHLDALSPGGTLAGALLRQLLERMPPGQTQTRLLEVVAQKNLFYFDVGRIEVTTEGETHQMILFLDGDHLLKITIRFPKETLKGGF